MVQRSTREENSDIWLNAMPLCDSHQEIFRLAKNKKAKVMENYYKVGVTLNWKWEWVRDSSTKEKQEEVGSIIRLLGEVEGKCVCLESMFKHNPNYGASPVSGEGSRVDFVTELWNDGGIWRSFVSKMHGGKDNMVANMQMGKDSLPNNRRKAIGSC
ncbi:hypothetical protein E3N88_26422 [Mikania micrantha]|uniref:Uncharacterized protein n=1 Tax=Mikania micrantha TaxID=192012 RepID=A0A5N6N9G3_9ASTR|nr:hypothetical protein E3N88_26422 [Mikania micrantha]